MTSRQPPHGPAGPGFAGRAARLLRAPLGPRHRSIREPHLAGRGEAHGGGQQLGGLEGGWSGWVGAILVLVMVIDGGTHHQLRSYLHCNGHSKSLIGRWPVDITGKTVMYLAKFMCFIPPTDIHRVYMFVPKDDLFDMGKPLTITFSVVLSFFYCQGSCHSLCFLACFYGLTNAQPPKKPPQNLKTHPQISIPHPHQLHPLPWLRPAGPAYSDAWSSAFDPHEFPHADAHGRLPPSGWRQRPSFRDAEVGQVAPGGGDARFVMDVK